MKNEKYFPFVKRDFLEVNVKNEKYFPSKYHEKAPNKSKLY